MLCQFWCTRIISVKYRYTWWSICLYIHCTACTLEIACTCTLYPGQFSFFIKNSNCLEWYHLPCFVTVRMSQKLLVDWDSSSTYAISWHQSKFIKAKQFRSSQSSKKCSSASNCVILYIINIKFVEVTSFSTLAISSLFPVLYSKLSRLCIFYVVATTATWQNPSVIGCGVFIYKDPHQFGRR